MRVRVIAPFKIPGKGEGDWMEVAEGTRVRDLLRGAKLHPSMLLPVLVNGEKASRSRQLQDGDTVVFLHPLSGG